VWTHFHTAAGYRELVRIDEDPVEQTVEYICERLNDGTYIAPAFLIGAGQYPGLLPSGEMDAESDESYTLVNDVCIALEDQFERKLMFVSLSGTEHGRFEGALRVTWDDEWCDDCAGYKGESIVLSKDDGPDHWYFVCSEEEVEMNPDRFDWEG
jgi:hypothetical protein